MREPVTTTSLNSWSPSASAAKVDTANPGASDSATAAATSRDGWRERLLLFIDTPQSKFLDRMFLPMQAIGGCRSMSAYLCSAMQATIRLDFEVLSTGATSFDVGTETSGAYRGAWPS